MAEASVAVKVPLGEPVARTQVVWPSASVPMGSAVTGTLSLKIPDGMYSDMTAAVTSTIELHQQACVLSKDQKRDITRDANGNKKGKNGKRL